MKSGRRTPGFGSLARWEPGGRSAVPNTLCHSAAEESACGETTQTLHIASIAFSRSGVLEQVSFGNSIGRDNAQWRLDDGEDGAMQRWVCRY